jgi:antitoxin (DNA-binding transcriptional repressor) of toxin-antitoxin stability system
MKQMSIEELATNLSEAIQQVSKGETIEVTSNGNVVALLTRPSVTIEIIKEEMMKGRQVPDDMEARRAALAQLDALAEEIGKHVTQPTDVAKLISEMRR